jgi:hypothetical protein
MMQLTDDMLTEIARAANGMFISRGLTNGVTTVRADEGAYFVEHQLGDAHRSVDIRTVSELVEALEGEGGRISLTDRTVTVRGVKARTLISMIDWR